MLTAIRRAWTWLTDDHVVGASPGVARHFLRCERCGHLFMHFWGCKEPHEAGRVGCRCGSVRAGIVRLPEWQAACVLLGCYVWRRLLQRKRFWDPRMPSREVHVDA